MSNSFLNHQSRERFQQFINRTIHHQKAKSLKMNCSEHGLGTSAKWDGLSSSLLNIKYQWE